MASRFAANRSTLVKFMADVARERCKEDADKVLKHAQAHAPVYGSGPAPPGHRRGAYKKSLRSEKSGRNGYEISANVYYALWVEYGSKRVVPHHTLGNALDTIKER